MPSDPKYSIKTSTLTGIADAIRAKTGGSLPIDAEDMATEIAAIPSGGSTHRLPSEYQEVEYIQTDGSAYIDTGYSFSGDAQFEFEMLYAGSGTYLLGATNNDHTQRFIVTASNTGYTFYGTNDQGTSYASYAFAADHDIRNEMFDIKGIMRTGMWCCMTPDMRYCNHTASAVGSYAVENTMYFLAQHYGASTRGGAGNRGRRFYIADWDSAKSEYVPKRDMWACYKKSGTVIGMYDLVNDTFYANAGSGGFTKGPDVT